MLNLPDITPAPAEAAEHIRYRRTPVKYGLLGRILLARRIRRDRKERARLASQQPAWNAPSRWKNYESAQSRLSAEILRDIARPSVSLAR